MDTPRIVPLLLQQPYLPLEAITLGLGGMILVVAAILLDYAAREGLPFYSNGLYGLLLVLFAFQTVGLGKTPLGAFRRSPLLLIGGGAIAAVGVATCCIPTFHEFPRLLLLACFGCGGGVQLIRMLTAEDKLRQWVRLGSLFRHLIVSCSASYLLSLLITFVLWQEEALPPAIITAVLSLYALVLFYLAAVLRKVYSLYPNSENPFAGRMELSTTQAILLLLSIFMILLGLMLIPVSLGLLPFAPSAQIGLLMVFFALQMLAAGETPIGTFPRNWLMIGCGLLFAVAGIVSCIVPNLLLQPLTILIGILNVANGSLTVRNCWHAARRRGEQLPPPVSLLMDRLCKIQLLLGLLAVMFGGSMLLPGIIPGLVTGLILAANGSALLYLAQLLIRLDHFSQSTACISFSN